MLTMQQTLKIAKAISLAQVGDSFATAERSLFSRFIRFTQSVARWKRIETSHNAGVCKSISGEKCVMNCFIPTSKRVTLVAFLTDLEERGVPWELTRLAWRVDEAEKDWSAWEHQVSATLNSFDGMDYPERDLWEQFLIGIAPFLENYYENSNRPYCSDSIVKAYYSASRFHPVPPIFSKKYPSPALFQKARTCGVMVSIISSKTKIRRKV